MAVYYNEFEPYAAEWLRNLIKAGLIPDGEVDTRSIVDVRPDDLRAFTQCHFFAGIGGWSHALRLAGWPDERPIWTGSCPCQPFSVAGKGLGADDPRHLWPHFHRLISALRPPVVMGEQVSGAAGYGWLDGVRADLEGEGYACRGVDIPACAVDAPHIRQRLYWVARDMADANGGQSGEGRGDDGEMRRLQEAERQSKYGSALSVGSRQADGYMADSDRLRRPDERPDGVRRPAVHDADGRSERGHMVDARSKQTHQKQQRPKSDERERGSDSVGGCRVDHGQGRRNGTFWSDHVWLTGADGKARRVKSGVRLLAHGVPAKVGRLRAYGNAIVPQVAAEVIAAFMETES